MATTKSAPPIQSSNTDATATSSATSQPSKTPTSPANATKLTPPSDKQPYLLLHANGLAGAAAGASTALLTCPLDVIRTRFQVSKHAHADGLSKTVQLMLKEEGFLSLYKGMGPQLYGLVPSWAIYFSFYDWLKPKIASKLHEDVNPSAVHLVAAVMAGAVTNLGTTPFFTVKTRLQTQHITGGAHGDVYKGTLDCFRKTIKSEGLPVLWSGFIPSLFGLVHVAIQFPLYEKFKKEIKTYNNKPQSANLTIWETFVCAASSKVFASAAAYPHELIRSRLQAPPSSDKGQVRYSGVLNVCQRVLAEEGFLAFYHGLGITLLRTVPASMITLAVYEKTMGLIKSHYGQT